jgi:hypothetical protein
MSKQVRVRMIKTLAPVEIPNGTLGTVTQGDIKSGMALVHWDNDFVIPMYRSEVEVIEQPSD